MKEPRPAAASPHRASTPEPIPDYEAQLASIEQRRKVLADEEAALRRALWESETAAAKQIVQRLIAAGNDPAQIAKALGLAALSGSRAAARAKTGPQSPEGWYRNFRARGIQSYIHAHPDLAAKLKAQNTPASDYAAHIQPEALQEIEREAQAKADAKSSAGVRP